MLISYELENFKAFGNSTPIELAPITLHFGENSAGKSSILQSLNLLKQTRESMGQSWIILTNWLFRIFMDTATSRSTERCHLES